MNFATIQPKLSEYCFIAVRKRSRKRWLNWFQHTAVTASLLNAGAFFLFSVIGAQADEPSPSATSGSVWPLRYAVRLDAMSTIGPGGHSKMGCRMSAFEGKADHAIAMQNVS